MSEIGEGIVGQKKLCDAEGEYTVKMVPVSGQGRGFGQSNYRDRRYNANGGMLAPSYEQNTSPA